MRDLYEILGVTRKATAAEIKSAYRRRARRSHPDQQPDDPEAGKMLRELNLAYSVLSNQKKRALYDQYGAASLKPDFQPPTSTSSAPSRRTRGWPHAYPSSDQRRK